MSSLYTNHLCVYVFSSLVLINYLSCFVITQSLSLTLNQFVTNGGPVRDSEWGTYLPEEK